MRKQLIGTICLGALSVIGLVFWEPPAQAAGENKTVEIVLKSGAPVFRPETVEINAGGSITWVPKDAGIHHHFVNKADPKEEFTKDFNNNEDAVETATHEFPTPRVINYFCLIHPDSMKGTITVK